MSIQDPNSLFRIVEARVDIARVKVSRAREGRQRERERAGGEGGVKPGKSICTGAVTAQLPMKIEGKRSPIRWKMTLKPKRFFPFSRRVINWKESTVKVVYCSSL